MSMEYKKAIVIDDDEVVSGLICEILGSAGYECQAVYPLTDIEHNAWVRSSEIFFVDLVMDEIDGVELIKALRKYKADSIIIAITGLSAFDKLEEVMEAGADHYFTKPVKADLLLQRVNSIKERIIAVRAAPAASFLFETAFNEASNPVLISDKCGNLYYANGRFLEITKLNRQRIYRYDLQALEMENAKDFFELLKRSSQSRMETRSMEIHIKEGRDEDTWYNAVVNPISGEYLGQENLLLIQLFDITRRKQMDTFFITNEEKFRSFISLSNDGMALVNEDGVVIEWNKSLMTITGYSMAEVYGEYIWDIINQMEISQDGQLFDLALLRRFVMQALKRGLEEDRLNHDICQMKHADGHIVHLQYSLFTIRLEDGYRLGMVIRDNTETIEYQQQIEHQKKKLEEAYEKMEKLSRIDPLTQIANRRDVEIKLNYELSRFKRHHRPMVLAIADIDDFKKFNDTYGHDMGDLILVEISRIMNESIRSQDILGRWGGEEFILVFPETHLSGGMIIAERIRQNIACHQFRQNDVVTYVSVTIGLSQYESGEDLDKTLKRADSALYEGKKQGKNRVNTG